MATVEYKICDRCGKKISEHSRRLAKVSSSKTFRFLWIITGVTHTGSKELCGECSDKLDAFLYGKEESI
jgi:hypothetical protein